MTPLDFNRLREANVERCIRTFHPLKHWSASDWAVSMMGEAGEACNLIKKLLRHHDGTNTAKDPDTEEEIIQLIAEEIADTIIYADLLAARLGINLGEAVVRKFNKVSKLRGSSIYL